MTGIDPTQLRVRVIRPALSRIDLWSAAAEDLLLGTAAVESGCGRYLVQVGGGPALGIFQMEPATHDDLWENYLRFKFDTLGLRVFNMTERTTRASTAWRPLLGVSPHGFAGHTSIVCPSTDQLVTNLAYAAAMARVHYRRVPEPLPAAGDAAGMARFWKRHYNTPLGAGTEEKFLRAWKEIST
jgi:hypothetical protein